MNKRCSLVNFSTKYVKIYLSSAPQDHSVDCPEAGTVGYWIGKDFAREGYMREALSALVFHAFEVMDLSRIESACLPENRASRGLLESCGYKYEGVAQSYLQINGRWRNHVLYANLRNDRRGKVN